MTGVNKSDSRVCFSLDSLIYSSLAVYAAVTAAVMNQEGISDLLLYPQVKLLVELVESSKVE
jgi:hypothetical protein